LCSVSGNSGTYELSSNSSYSDFGDSGNLVAFLTFRSRGRESDTVYLAYRLDRYNLKRKFQIGVTVVWVTYLS
jgi:hypothetical protein